MIDFHLHPDYSIDSRISMAEIAEMAAEKNLDAICLTTHIDLNPKRSCLDSFVQRSGRFVRFNDAQIENYIAEVRALEGEYRDSLDILMGFEFSYGEHFEDKIAAFLEKHRPDFALGAIHCLDNIGITGRSEAPGYFRSKTPDRAAKDFTRATAEMVESGLFSTIAHIDGIKKYGRDAYSSVIDREVEPLFSVIFDRMANLDVGIEINTSTLRRGHPDMYPSEVLLTMARDAGVKVNSVGSDAHRKTEVGHSLKKAYELIERVGIDIGPPLSLYWEPVYAR